MKKLLLAAVALCLTFASPSFATNVNIDGLPAATSATGTDLLECEQGGTNNKCTAAQEAAYVYGLMSADATASGTGALTLATVNSNVGSFGSTTSCVTFTVNAKGLITAASAATCAPAIGSVTGLGTGVATALAIAPGTTGSFPTQDGSIVTGNCLKWGPGVQDAGAACGSGGSGISSLTPGAALVSATTSACSQSAITTSGTLSAAECLNAQVGTSYAIQDSDRGKLITGTNSSSQAYTIAQAGASTTFQSGWYARVQNKGTGTLVITPTTSTICGAASYTLMPNWTVKITSDGTNYQCDGGSTGNITISSQTGANYAFVTGNFGQLVNLSNGSNQVPTLPQAGSTGFPAGWYVDVCNQGAGTQTITPTTSTIGGASTLVLPASTAGIPHCVTIVSDGTNYQIAPTYLLPGSTIPNVIGTVTTQSGTTYTFASTDCGTTVRFTSSSAVTATIPQALPVGCNIAVEQAGTAKVSVNGSAVTPATLHSAHSYTGTSAQYAVIGVFTDSSNVAILTGDGS